MAGLLLKYFCGGITKLAIAIFSTAAWAVVFTTGCMSVFKRNSAQNIEKYKHYIMTLHGVRGNNQSFGDFNSLIKMHLEKAGSTT